MNNNIWETLTQENFVTGEQPIKPENTPWFVIALQVFGGWVASLVLIIFFALALNSLFDNGNEIMLIIIGLSFCVASFFILREFKHNYFLQQLGLAASFSGQFFVIFSIYQVLDHYLIIAHLFAVCFFIMLCVVMPNFIHKFTSAWAAIFVLSFPLYFLGLAEIYASLLVVASIIIWLREPHWSKWRKWLNPIGLALFFATLQLYAHLTFSMQIYDFGQSQQYPILSFWISSLIMLFGLSYLLLTLLKEHHVKLFSNISITYLVGGALIFLATFSIIGVMPCLLIILIGFYCQRKSLIGLGLISLLTFISWYYYNLQITLLNKSFLMMFSGVILVMFYSIVHIIFKKEDGIKLNITGSHFLQFQKITIQKAIIFVTVIASLGFVNINIYQKEGIIKNGEVILLKLAPVDPRSLMQGDYMSLRFDIERKITNNQSFNNGYVILNIDNNRVATFANNTDASELENNQIKILSKNSQYSDRFLTDAFFFQEGTGQLYEAAIYGEFRLSDKGELILNALIDKDFKVIGYNKE